MNDSKTTFDRESFSSETITTFLVVLVLVLMVGVVGYSRWEAGPTHVEWKEGEVLDIVLACPNSYKVFLFYFFFIYFLFYYFFFFFCLFFLIFSSFSFFSFLSPHTHTKKNNNYSIDCDYGPPQQSSCKLLLTIYSSLDV